MKHTITLFILISIFMSQKNYSVSYKNIISKDELRVILPYKSYNGNINTKNRNIYVRTQIWFPAENSSKKMNYADYLIQDKEFIDGKMNSDEQKDYINSQINIYSIGKPANEIKEIKERMYKPLKPFKNSSPLKGNFPLIIISDASIGNIALAESLAENGFIVLMSSNNSDLLDYRNYTAENIKYSLNYIKYKTQLKYSKIYGLGAGSGGPSILSFQMETGICDAIVSLDGDELFNNFYTSMKQLDTYNIDKLSIPYFRLHSDLSTKTPTRFLSDAKYMDRYVIEVNSNDLPHGYFQSSPNPLFQQKKKVTQFQELKVNLVNLFLNHISRHEQLHHVPNMFKFKSELVDSNYVIKALPTTITQSELKELVSHKKKDEVIKLLDSYLKNDPNFLNKDHLFYLGRNLSWTGKSKEAIVYFDLSRHYFPKQGRVYIETSKAYLFEKQYTKCKEYLNLAKQLWKEGKIDLKEKTIINLEKYISRIMKINEGE